MSFVFEQHIFKPTPLRTKPQAHKFLKTIDSYVERNYVSWNLGCRICYRLSGV